MKNIFKNHIKISPRETCYFCNKPLDERSSSLRYTTEEMEEVEYGQICGACSDILDKLETGIYDVEVESDDDDQSV